MDRLSALPDELIHKILSSVESNVAVQTCVLSKRWVNFWSTLRFLKFELCHFDNDAFYYHKFVNDFISHRNQESDTCSIEIDFEGFDPALTRPFFDYAISHNVEKFHFRHANFHCDLSFPLLIDLSISNSQVPLWDWRLPCLTSLRLESVNFLGSQKLLSFPVLKTLHLSDCKLSSFMYWSCVSLVNLCIEHVTFNGGKRDQSFPVLRTLRLTHCQVYLKDWSLPCLINLHLDHVTCPGNNRLLSFWVLETLHLSHSEVPFWDWSLPVLSTLHLERVRTLGDGSIFSFEGFNMLKNLTLVGCHEVSNIVIFVITYTVTSLTISQCFCARPPTCKFVIAAPNLSFFKFQGNYVPRFSAEDCLSRLIEVDFDIDIGKYVWKSYEPEKRKQLIQKLTNMFHVFRGTKFLKLSFMTIKVLSRISDFSEYQPFPFCNLESLKVLGSTPRSERMMEFPAHVLSYLLSSSPGARIFIQDYWRKLRNYDPRTNMLTWFSYGYCVTKKSTEDTVSDRKSIVSNSVRNPEEVQKKRKACPEGQQATSKVQITGDGIDRVLQVIPPTILPRAVNDKTCSCSENNSFSLWEGHQVYSQYVDLLAYIKEKHPETFEHFTPRTDIMYTMGLNTLCGSVKAFSEDSLTGFTASKITSYRDLFADMEKLGFNTSWLVNHLSNADRLLL